MGLERIATDTYDFENVRTTGYTYVDKTGLLYPLVDGSMGKQFSSLGPDASASRCSYPPSRSSSRAGATCSRGWRSRSCPGTGTRYTRC